MEKYKQVIKKNEIQKKQQYSSIFGRIKRRYVETRVKSGLYFDISYTFNEVIGSDRKCDKLDDLQQDWDKASKWTLCH